MSDDNENLDQQIDTRDDPVAHAAAKSRKKGMGATAAPVEPRFPSSGQDATMLWDEVVADGKARGLGADQFQMSVTREMVADRPVKVSLGTIDGSSVHLGGTELQRAITEMWHLNSKMRGNTKYKVVFTQKGTGRILTTGYMTLADQEELQGFGASPAQGFGGQGFGAYPQPPRFYPVPIPQMAPAQAPQTAAPQAAPSHTDATVAAALNTMQYQLQAAQQQTAQLMDVLLKSGSPQAVLEVMRAGGLGAIPAPAAVTPEAVAQATAKAVAETLVALGVVKPQGQQSQGAQSLGATPPPAPLTPQQVAEKQIGDMRNTLKTFREFKELFSAISDETSEGLGAAPQEPEKPANPEEYLPFQRVTLGNWEWAVDKETGDPSWHGILAGVTNKFMNDPAARDQLFGFLGRVTSVVEKIAQGKAGLGAAQMQQQTPMLHGSQPSQGNGQGQSGWGSMS